MLERKDVAPEPRGAVEVLFLTFADMVASPLQDDTIFFDGDLTSGVLAGVWKPYTGVAYYVSLMYGLHGVEGIPCRAIIRVCYLLPGTDKPGADMAVFESGGTVEKPLVIYHHPGSSADSVVDRHRGRFKIGFLKRK